jgi:hypothetical protein
MRNVSQLGKDGFGADALAINQVGQQTDSEETAAGSLPGRIF